MFIIFTHNLINAFNYTSRNMKHLDQGKSRTTLFFFQKETGMLSDVCRVAAANLVL